jgi:aminopeptidase YwaD
MIDTQSTYTHLKALLEFGPRPLGSNANQAAADYIRDWFLSLNYQVEEQEYSCTAFDHASANLYIDETAFPVEANAFSLPCDVRGVVLPLGSVTELQAAEITGRIVLFYGDLASQPLSPKSWFLKSERDELIIGCLEAGRPAALLAPPAETAEYMQLTMDWELDLLAATIPLDIALTLLQQPGTPIHLTIQGERRPASARNIVARSSSKTGSSRVVLCAHFDTMINTPGASDNAAGVAVLLALAETLRSEELPYELEFVAFNGEEYLPIGDDEYIRRSGDSLDDILFALNIDGIGPAYTSSTITMMAADQAFQSQVEQISAAFPGVVWVDPWPESNHSTFAMRGVPAMAFSSRGARRLAHTRDDALHVISTAKMDEVHRLAAEIVRSRPAVTRAKERSL